LWHFQIPQIALNLNQSTNVGQCKITELRGKDTREERREGIAIDCNHRPMEMGGYEWH
jgi:hypothetical protein